MSLDVYLTMHYLKVKSDDVPADGAVFIREEGRTREIDLAEWDARFPDREPVVLVAERDENEVYNGNITHNLGKMAREAEVYEPLWRPIENGFTKARQLIEPLKEGLTRLESDPARFKQFDSSNGWGVYENLVGFVRDYLSACEQYPDADVSVWR